MTVKYTVRNEDGDVVDASEEGNPLILRTGTDELIKGFEDAVKDLKAGEETDFTVSGKEGYGERDEKLVMKLPLDRFPSEHKPQKGMFYSVRTDDDKSPSQFRVLEVEDDHCIGDFNHPLAGHVLKFHVEVQAVEDLA